MDARTAAAAVCLLVLAGPALVRADIYEGRGDGGTVVFTDAPTEPGYRLVVRTDPVRVPWRQSAHRAAREAGLDPALVRAVIVVESGENPRAVSPKGAQGLMQLMPGTAEELGVLDPLRPRDNLRGGTRYLAQLVDRYDGRLDLALAAYNAGPAVVDRHNGVPPYPETRAFVRKVLDLYAQIKERSGVDTR